MTKLLRHMIAMQGMAQGYLMPGQPYVGRNSGASSDYPNGEKMGMRDNLFAGDMLYMLDGPEQREAQFDFLNLSARTVSDQFHGELVPLDALRDSLAAFQLAAERLDVIKKLIFYGEDEAKGRTRLPGWKHRRDCNEVPATIAQLNDIDGPLVAPDEAEQILHAVLGVATEAGEMVEALYKCIFEGAELDLTNLLEESGDVKWYLAILCRVMGVDWDHDERRCIAKLQERYPGKFDSLSANNRDLVAERAALEGEPDHYVWRDPDPMLPASQGGADGHDVSIIPDHINENASVRYEKLSPQEKATALIADCATQFRMYEAQHRAKGSSDKADTNAEFAERCEKTLELF